MCMIDDADGWTVFHASEPVARIEHRCGDCGRTIVPGERYHRGEGLYEDYWSTNKVCGHCNAASKWLLAVCHGYLYGGIIEDLVEHWDESWEVRSLDFGRLIVLAHARWRRHGELVPVETVEKLSRRAVADYRERLARAAAA